MRRLSRRRVGAAVALLAVVGVVVAVILGTRSPSSAGSAGGSEKAAGATTVRRRDLVATDTEAGTLSYSDPQTVYNRLSGTVTWLPNVGQVIRPGHPLYEIDGQPVLLMQGSLPAYRDLSVADSPGADIEELNRNLVALGFNADGIVIDDEWQPGTTLGVELLQESLDEPETGSLSLGRVVFLRGDQVVSALDTTVGSTGGGGGSAASAPTAVGSAGPQFVVLRTAANTSSSWTVTSSTTTQTTPSTAGAAPTKSGAPPAPRTAAGSPSLAGLTALLKAEAAQLKAATAALKAAKAASGPSAGSSPNKGGGTSSSPSLSSPPSSSGATAILQTTSTQLVVTVDLSASSPSEAKVGEGVTVELPAGQTVAGRIIAVSRVAQSASGSDSGSLAGGGGSSGGGGGGAGGSSSSSSTIPVTIKLRGDRTGRGLDQAAVSVNFAQTRARHVLSVPVTALLAIPGGNYAVQEATAPHLLLPVTTGLFAAGYVKISGPGIRAGLEVTDSQG